MIIFQHDVTLDLDPTVDVKAQISRVLMQASYFRTLCGCIYKGVRRS
jgi:hypothetical protein